MDCLHGCYVQALRQMPPPLHLLQRLVTAHTFLHDPTMYTMATLHVVIVLRRDNLEVLYVSQVRLLLLCPSGPAGAPWWPHPWCCQCTALSTDGP